MRVTVVAVSVCLSVCLSIKSYLTSGASVLRENAAMCSACNKSQNICNDFSETAPLPRSSAPSLGWPYILSVIFPADNTHVHCAYASSRAMDAPCRKLSLCSSFTMIILELVRVVQLAIYRCVRYISGTVVLL